MSALVAAAGNRLSPASRAWIADATAFSSFAGPDAQAVHLDDDCGIGLALLRTTTTDPAQPISLDGRTWLVADVRLDDVTGLRRQLRDSLAGDSDTHLVLRAYARWGEHFLDHLEGEFSLVLWNRVSRRLLCARDQWGQRPLHYAEIKGTLLVATSIDALLLHPEVSGRLDDGAIGRWLVGAPTASSGSGSGSGNSNGKGSGAGAGDPERTAFASIRRLAPAHLLTWSGGRTRSCRYWQLLEPGPLVRYRHVADYAERFNELFDAAVTERLTTSQVSLQLSGGLDSTSIAVSASRAMGKSAGGSDGLLAVSVFLGGSSGDEEGDYARLVAEDLGLRAEMLDASKFEAIDPNDEPTLVTPEPTPYQRTALQYEFARRQALHSPLALAGIGGDALLWFDRWYWVNWLVRGQGLRLARAAHDNARVLRSRPHPHLQSGIGRLLSPTRDYAQLPTWLNRGLADTYKIELTRPVRVQARDRDARSLATDPIWSTMFTSGDASFTRLPVQFRYPMLDLRLVRYVIALPPEPWLMDKRILREATRGRLPNPVRVRPKAPLKNTPGLGRQHREILAGFVRDVAALEDFADREALARALTTHREQTWQQADVEFGRILGLAHWLAHRRQPPEQRDRCQTAI